MGVAAPRAPFGVRDPLKSSVTGLSLLYNHLILHLIQIWHNLGDFQIKCGISFCV